ncbi:MAG: SCO1664 family protein [Acidimicrobiales bacterium]
MSEDSQEISEVLDATVDVGDEVAAPLLERGEIEILGRMPWSSNGTYLVTVSDADGLRCQGIYKPEAGERPLWDFPSGLWRREVAAYRLAAELGWAIVPPTVERDGPLGVGSLQFFVPSRFEEHYFTFKDETRHRRALEQLCLFDLVSNNTDRKGGHILLSELDHLWGIDHGLSFHEEFKLRTVMWDFAGDPIAADLAADLVDWLDRDVSEGLRDLLTDDEVAAMRDRTASVVRRGTFPHDPTGRRYPWPLV